MSTLYVRFSLAGFLALITTGFVSAQPKNVDDAVKKGAAFLSANWALPKPQNAYGAGSAALAGMAMLEAGVKPDDVGMKAVTNYLREVSLAQTETYHVSLCILFFDKLADPRDVPAIQLLGVRLYAGLNAAGGWSYSTWESVSEQELVRLRRALQTNDLVGVGARLPVEPKPVEPKPIDPKPADPFFQPPGGAQPLPKPIEVRVPVEGRLHAEVARTQQLVNQTIRNRGRQGGAGDNSNTQFGTIGLWVASKHGVQAADAFNLIELRYLRSQNRDGGWGYREGGHGRSSLSMTCAGLIGLAVGAANRDRQLVAANVAQPAEANVAPPMKDDNPFFNPKKPAVEPVKPAAVAGKKPEPANLRERSIEAGLQFAGKVIAAIKANPLALEEYATPGNGHYMLWSVERMAVAYGLDSIGDQDWYRWGSDYLLSTQAGDGSWNPPNYTPEVNTAFAILFLTKANSVRDLSGRIKGKVKDPGRAELRAGGAVPFAPVVAPPEKPVDAVKPMVKTEPGFQLPTVISPTIDAEADRIAKGLAAATADTWQSRLAEARDTKGTSFTRALTLAAGRLEGTRRIEARDALAERLTRMTPATLRTMLRDGDAELRRAACLACAVKEDKSFVPDLTERITDASELVVRAARAGLKSLTSADFGPESASDEEAKLQAAAAWRAWWIARQGKK